MKGSQVNAQDLSLYSASSLTLSQASGLNVANNLQAASAGDLTLDALKLNLTGSPAAKAAEPVRLSLSASSVRSPALAACRLLATLRPEAWLRVRLEAL